MFYMVRFIRLLLLLLLLLCIWHFLCIGIHNLKFVCTDIDCENSPHRRHGENINRLDIQIYKINIQIFKQFTKVKRFFPFDFVFFERLIENCVWQKVRISLLLTLLTVCFFFQFLLISLNLCTFVLSTDRFVCCRFLLLSMELISFDHYSSRLEINKLITSILFQ